MKNTRSKTIFSFFTKDGRLDPLKLKEDLEDVREYYQNKGYIDMEVTQTKLETNSKGKTTLYIYIKEGDQYRISKLSIKGTRRSRGAAALLPEDEGEQPLHPKGVEGRRQNLPPTSTVRAAT